ncbi:hypothetical protein [uncultured Dokdonia sp.]|uniref:hypothetical protein n=1 Tax=uncultured Dokdonia sp. TaxID=575653 RepID=UPI00263036AB|nr:hypothetical protein [uncultured Dokdonia sp.]
MLGRMKMVVFIVAMLYMGACNQDDRSGASEVIAPENEVEAAVVSVVVSGEGDTYTFNVGVSSPDTGCDQYANWWEIVSEDGTLMYRRILAHSHVNEQPFVRSGSTMNINANQEVIVRVHMNTTGYSVKGYKGSVANGFAEFLISEDFASELANQSPQPDGCAF